MDHYLIRTGATASCTTGILFSFSPFSCILWGDLCVCVAPLLCVTFASSVRKGILHRPTPRAAWWDTSDSCHIFSGRDLARPERGTWLGITRQGRIAVLTNYREAFYILSECLSCRGFPPSESTIFCH
ncbi:hypothetical protein DFH27DRAFT_134977 [Peziza echinospora]|nr:hypothetical protein DFH27DRAFT_134977 [Peziza echinospora]